MDNNNEIEQRGSGGAFFRHMLRNVEPEHVSLMIDMLHRMQHTEKPIVVPREGTWAMKMPEGYLLLGEGPMGFDIDPPPGRARRPGGHCLAKVSNLVERDTERILSLAKQALGMNRPELDDALAQLFGLNFDLCDAEAVRAIDELTWALIADERR